jgi:hypothetical protein
MSKTPKTDDDFVSIDPSQLEAVAGGAKGGDAQVMAMLSSIGDSIKSLASSNQSSGSDPMQMMMMMMMMGGMGGGGGGAPVAAPAAAPQVIDVQATIPGGGGGCGRGRGKKGW